MMDYQEIIRLGVMALTAIIAAFIGAQLWRWHSDEKDPINLRDLLTVLGKDGKQHMSRAAVAELTALFATTSGYIATLALRPQDYETSTLVYAGLWISRGAFSTFLRSKQK